MMFQPEHIELIRRGEKTQTRRDWDDDYAGSRVGSVVMATPSDLGPIVGHADCDCYIRITRRWSEPLSAISTRTADREGGYTVQGFKHLWEDLNGEFDPDLRVEVLEFEYVGRQRPESELQKTLTDGGRDIEDADSERYGPFHYEGTEGFEAWGFHFPSGLVIIEWIPASVPDDVDHIDGYHQSVYHSFEDFRTVCTGSIAWGGSP